MPKYSFMVPVYNKELLIERCLNSLVNQTYNDFEIVVVDDGSCDNSCNLLLDLSNKNNYIKLYRNERNLGIGETRNRLLSLANGEYLIFVDPDDYVEERLLEELNKYLIRDLDIVRFQNVIEPVTLEAKEKEKNRDKYRYSFPVEGVISGEQALLLWMMGPRQINTFPWTYCIKRYIYDDIKYPDTRYLEDFSITPYLLAKSKRIMSIPFVGYHYCKYDSTLSSSNEDVNLKIEKLKIFREIIKITYRNIYATDISDEAKELFMNDVENRYNIRKRKLDLIIK